MVNQMLIKQASFAEDALKTIKDKTHLIDRPFETIFGAMLPMILWPSSKVLSALMFIGEAVGFGPGLIGRLIDKALGMGQGKSDFSDGNLKGAATTTVDTLLGKLGLGSESMIRDLYLNKQTIELHELVALAAYVKQNPIKKEARPYGRTNFLRRFLRQTRTGGRIGLINGLWWLLKTFAKGLIGLGIAGGVVGLVKKHVAPEGMGDLPGGLGLPQNEDRPSIKTDVYLNTNNNIEDTLIHFLNSAYKVRVKDKMNYVTFSEMFQELNGYVLKGSREMQEILKVVDGLNWGELSDINDKRTFVGPTLENIAKTLIPVMSLESAVVTDENRELLQALKGVYK